MIKGIIWDIDGTLLNSMSIWFDVGKRYLIKKGITPEENLGEILYPMTMDQGGEYLKNHYNLEESLEELKENILAEIAEFYKNEARLKDGVKDIVLSLAKKKIPMILATTGHKAFAKAALERVGIWECFSELIAVSDLNTSKHEPLIYYTAAERMGLKPEEILVAEDASYALETAKNAGFITVAIKDESNVQFFENMKQIADYYIEDYSKSDIFNSL